ncbi:MAG: PTS fructose transporter subunit IIABC [Spirochaetia bacterium]
MKISDLLTTSTISVDLQAQNKDTVINELVGILDQAGKISDPIQFKNDIWARETQVSTGSENGLAVPHAKSRAVKEAAIAFGLSKSGIDYDSIDGKPSRLFFMIAVGETASNLHLDVLARLTTLLMNAELKVALMRAKTSQDILNALNEHENAYLAKESAAPTAGPASILAVTACPVGIAHTYMAADSLRTKASEMGISIKVETNGSSGIKNALSATEIQKAEVIIIAADKKIELARFAGKKVLEVPISQAIKNPQELLDQARKGDVPVYIPNANNTPDIETSSSSFYRHLMSGVSNMLPFVIAGGILIAISFMFGIKAFDPGDAAFNPFAKFLMDIGGGSGAFGLLIPILAGFIGLSIADRPGFMPAMVGGVMAASSGAGFLGGMVAGFLGGYVIVFLKKITEKLPQVLDSIKAILIFPILGLLITGGIMVGVVDWIAALNIGLNTALMSLSGTNLVFLGILLAGMMAVDLGGPVNKVAFTFGIAAIEAGNNLPHAAVMAGGMVPPLAIALATTFFKNKFTASQRESGAVNYIMGASFITEGAIPFAAADPLRILPACIVGSAVAGGLSMAFGCQLPAPHGGFFVLPLIQNWPLYIIAILVGSAISATIIGFSKKSITQ